MTEFDDHAWPDGAGNYYGNQPSRQEWAPGNSGQLTIAEHWKNPEYVWRVSAFGVNVQFELLFGTRGQYTLSGLRAPLRAHLAGKFLLTAQPINPALPAWAVGGFTAASAGVDALRAVHTTAGPAVELPSPTRQVTALTAATVTVAGVAVPLAQGASLDVVAPAVLTAGTVIADYTV